ncbi:glycoside hydrolase family 127 protein [Lewinella sp. IMCC34191]|uniref:glycoside hydrolase family 127 protein n=1 Tax=Lewinella sp. IMCC34191 TaxID=2259172 RepID=UPI000E22D892|nr:glycoside hydrolase family 127 protein [Lewinella sp. IMCC34191]
MRQLLPICLLLCLTCCLKAQSTAPQDRTPVDPFPLHQVTLLDGPFHHATELNEASLLSYNPDRLLARFRMQAGLEPKAEAYGGWEAESLAGHSLGHHLSALALMYQTTGRDTFKRRAAYIVDQLTEIQRANGGQYLGAFDNGKEVFENEVAKGDIRSQGFDLNGIWAPFYTHHKVMAGLRDAYQLLGIKQALEVEKNFADWIGGIVLGLSEEEVQHMLDCEFGGVQETLADLYADTGEEKYLEIARVFHDESIIDSLAMGEDILPGKHGNTQIPKLIASSRLYEITGEESDRKPAEFFWDRVVHHHSYVTGGHGNWEYFGAPDRLTNRLSEGTTETCNVYNMLKLSRHLFLWEPRAEVADYYERALFNQILSSQDPTDGRVVYNLSLEMGGHKAFQDPEWFTCCIGTGMENHSKYGANIYYHDDDALYVTQFIASELAWAERGLTLTQQTNFPEAQSTELTLSLDIPQTFTLHLRHPFWAASAGIKINGEPQSSSSTPGTFIALTREWSDGDVVTLDLPFHLRLEAMPDDTNRIAVFYGPLALAADLGPVNDPEAEARDYVPVLMSESRDPAEWLEPVAGQVNTFRTTGIGEPRDVELRPFYRVNDRTYTVYLDLFNDEQWARRQATYDTERERKRRLEAITFDRFQPGEMQPERDHQFTGDKLNLEEDFRGRKARGSERGGWLSFTMKTPTTGQIGLVLEYWGGYTGSKTFDILVNGEKIATENISGKADGKFIDVRYEIPQSLTLGREEITVKLLPHTGHRAGPFFFARTVTGEE